MSSSTKNNYDKINRHRQKIKQSIISEQASFGNSNPSREQKTRRDYVLQKESYVLDNCPNFASSLSRSSLRKVPSELLKIDRNNQEGLDAKLQDQRTAQKSPISKSPMKGSDFSRQGQVTKRKVPTKGNQRYYMNLEQQDQSDQGFNYSHNLSSFDTFSQKLVTKNTPFTRNPPFGQSLSEQQIQILLQQNHALGVSLNQKLERIKSLQKQLKSIVKSEILHEEKCDIEMSQLIAQNQMLKRSNDEKTKKLLQQIKKLNQQLKQKQDQWQSRLNMVRKLNLEQTQQVKKDNMIQQGRYKCEIQQMKIQIQITRQQSKNIRSQNQALVQSLRNQILQISQSIEQLAHTHKIQRSQLVISQQNRIKYIQDEHAKKQQHLNSQSSVKQTQLRQAIQTLNGQIIKLQGDLERAKHDREFNEIKQMQQRGKLLIQLKQEKQKGERAKRQQKDKMSKMSNSQHQVSIMSYQSHISQLQNTIKSLEMLLESRLQQTSNLYRQISQMRVSYQEQAKQKQSHVQNLQGRIKQLTQRNQQQRQCLQIKLAQLTQANQQTLKQIYQHKITQQKHLLIDKTHIIEGLRQNITQQIQQANLIVQEHYQQVRQFKISIQKLQQQLSSNVLKEKTNNKVLYTQKQVVKQNLFQQSQLFHKSSQIKQQNIRRLQKIILTKDTQIQQLQHRLQLLKNAHKQQLISNKQQQSIFIQQNKQEIRQLKEQVQYCRKQMNKKSQQFNKDKEYYSNQFRQLKLKEQEDFNQWVENLSGDINSLKVENQQMKHMLNKISSQYTQYQQLWNEQKILVIIRQQQRQFTQRLKEDFGKRQQKLIQSYEQLIQKNYKSQLKSMSQLISEKEQQIQDMRINYHELERKFEQLIEEKQQINQINEKVLELGKESTEIVGNFISLS